MNNNVRILTIPCIECGNMLQFCIEDEVIVQSDGRIAINVPAVVCEGCVERLLQRVGDPPGLIIFEGLSAIVAKEIVESFPLLLPKSDALEFFQALFSG